MACSSSACHHIYTMRYITYHSDMVSCIAPHKGYIIVNHSFNMPNVDKAIRLRYTDEYGYEKDRIIYTTKAFDEPIINNKMHLIPGTLITDKELYIDNISGIKIIFNTYNIYADFNTFHTVYNVTKHLKNKFYRLSKFMILYVYITNNGFYLFFLAIRDNLMCNFIPEEITSGLLDYYIYNFLVTKKDNPYLPIKRTWFYTRIYPLSKDKNYIVLNTHAYKIKKISKKIDANYLTFAYVIVRSKDIKEYKGIKIPEVSSIVFYDIHHEPIVYLDIDAIDEESMAALILHFFGTRTLLSNAANCAMNIDFNYEIDYLLM